MSYTEFKRHCKTLSLRNDPKLIANYRKIHSKGQVWPEIVAGMREVGILDMEIYIVGTTLFMIVDTVPEFNHDEAMKELAKKPRQSEWETYVSRFQNVAMEATAGEKWKQVERIYKMGE